VKHKADGPVLWYNGFTRIAALDPAFTNGGDRSVVMLGKYGRDIDGRSVLQYDRYEYLQEDVTNKREPRNFQIARAFLDLLQKEGIALQHAAIDSTGAGNPFCDIVDHLSGSTEVLRVNFSGKASSRPVSETDGTPSCDKYANRVSEIWYSGHEFIRSGQLKGIMPALAKEMVARWVETVKGATMKLRVETKTDMKARIGFSPDIADSAFILLDLVRERLGATAGGAIEEGESKPAAGFASQFKQLRLSVRTFARRRG
jgi:hypothetical protein